MTESSRAMPSDAALRPRRPARADARFRDPDFTATGEPRATVRLARLETLWVHTGTLCNVECEHCFLRAGPVNNRLVYPRAGDLSRFLDEAEELELPLRQVAFTGGEPFMSPGILAMLGDALGRGYGAAVLTNAMRPLQRPAIRRGLLDLLAEHGPRLALRVSLDHYLPGLHDGERGDGAWERALAGLGWLAEHGFRVSVAGRTRWGQEEAATRRGYGRLFAARGIPLDADDPVRLALLPEADGTADVPEIAAGCWQRRGIDPSTLMCATGRVIARRRGSARPVVLSCTMVPYDPAFELGESLAGARGAVKLAHPHCSSFCVLGGGTCAVPAGD